MPLESAAKRIRRDRSTVYRWIGRGLHTVEINGRRFVKLSTLTAYAAEHGRRRGRKD
jgi:transposase-like protein